MLYKLIVNRKMLEYTAFNALEDYFRFICCKSKRSLKNEARSAASGKRHLYFRKARDRLTQDLDISGLLQVRYGFDIMKSILFDEDDLVLQSL